MSLPKGGTGKLNKRVTLQSPIYTQQAGGAEIVSGWNDVATVWASIKGTTGSELIQGDQVQGNGVVSIVCRAIVPVQTSWRVYYNGKLYNITFVDDFEQRHEYLILTCSEYAA